MRGHELLEKMELAAPIYVTEADTASGHKKHLWVRWGAAACAMLAAGGLLLYPRLARDPYAELPILPMTEFMGSHGFEGYMAYDISELVSGNPWSAEMGLKSLPVFRNPISYSEQYHIAEGADFEKMEAVLLDVASRLGLDTDSLVITDDAPTAEQQEKSRKRMELTGGTVPEGYFNPTRLMASAGGFSVEVDIHMTVTVRFDTPAPLPEGIRFTHDASHEDMIEAAEYLKTTFAELLAMVEPTVSITGGDYNIYGEQSYGISFFDGAGTDTDRLVSYNLRTVTFSCNDAGEVFLIRLRSPDLAESVGEYPIITVSEAEALLLSGNYITTVPEEMPGEAYIRKSELVYRSGQEEAYFMPYYRFYAELPSSERENGLITYGAYYVPAVEGAYLSEMPVWDGTFN